MNKNFIKFIVLGLLVGFVTYFGILLVVCLLEAPARYPSEAPSIITVLLLTGVPLTLFFSWLIWQGIKALGGEHVSVAADKCLNEVDSR